jgi:hypothetical protein
VFVNALFKNFQEKIPDTFEKNTSSTLPHTVPSRALSMITPANSSMTPNQAGDIYYSTVLRFVKRFREDFSIFLRKASDHTHTGFIVSESVLRRTPDPNRTDII